MIFTMDDDAAVRDSLSLLLECEGFETQEFASCREFLDADGAGKGDCLLLDARHERYRVARNDAASWQRAAGHRRQR